jgi:hypothetical protein
MYPHLTEIASEARLEEIPRCQIKRVASRA